MLKTTQIGGKGTIRRKKKYINNNDSNRFRNRITEEERLYIKKLENINKLILLIEDDNYDKFKIFLDNELEDLGFAIEKNDLKKNKKKDISEIKDDSLNYIYNLLIKEIDKPLQCNEKNYKIIKNTFDEDFIEIITDFFNDLEKNILKKEYLKDKNKEN